MAKTNYIAKGAGPEVLEVICDLAQQGCGDGLLLILRGTAIEKLRSDGTLERYEIPASRAAQLGLQLDDTGKVKCV